MTKNSLDLSRKIDAGTIELYEIINRVANELSISYVVVGATARDLVLHHGFGTPVRRATTDIDFGMQVESWRVFEKLKSALLENDFKETELAYRLISPENTKIDIVPFGKLEDKVSNIKWPPKGDFVMSVLGFQEAHDHAINVIIQQNPLIEIPVATSQGLALLKLISWSEREIKLKQKDAEDFTYLLETYEKVGDVGKRIYAEEGLMDQYGWEITLASAHMLGNDSALIAESATTKQVIEILDNNLVPDGQSKLVRYMCGFGNYDEAYNQLQAFANGFGYKNKIL